MKISDHPGLAELIAGLQAEGIHGRVSIRESSAKSTAPVRGAPVDESAPSPPSKPARGTLAGKSAPHYAEGGGKLLIGVVPDSGPPSLALNPPFVAWEEFDGS